MANVEFSGVRKVYDNGFVAVHDATFTIDDGEFVVLVGPSGCGKSTTLRMVAGLESISDGTLQIGEEVVNQVAPKDRDIAMVFQNYALYPHMTVRENMGFGLKLRKFKKQDIQDRVVQAADVLGIRDILDRKPKQLSGGQRQRVAVGRAIVRKPRVFLFDEPLSNLDAKLRVQMRTEISKLHRQLRATMIYVTHDQVEAMTMGDRIVVMKDGHIQQIAPPLELYNEPANRFVAGFIGSPAMNFFDGSLEEEKGFLFREAGGGFTVPLDLVKLPHLRPYANKKITLGIRPEDIRVHTGKSSPEENLVESHLDVLEPMGNEIFVYGKTAHHPIVARVDPQPLPEPGSALTLVLDTEKFHFFSEGGNRITP